VSVLADWCVIDVLDGGARLRRLRVAFGDPTKAAIARKLEKSAEDDRVARSLPPMASMVVPLVGRVRTLGVMTFLAADPRRSYREPERQLARELGRLAGLVLESAPPAGRLPTSAVRRRNAMQRAARPDPVAR
jgi:GAF domain-containing protein